MNLSVQNVLMCMYQNSMKRNSERSKQKMRLLECFTAVYKGFNSTFLHAHKKIFAVLLLLLKDARLIALGTEFRCIHRQI